MVTYRTSNRASDLRSIVVEDLRQSVVLLPVGTLSILQGKHKHGPACACLFWAEELGLDVSHNIFAVPVEQVVASRPIRNVKISKRKH